MQMQCVNYIQYISQFYIQLLLVVNEAYYELAKKLILILKKAFVTDI